MAIYESNITYLPIPRKLHYLVAHVYFRSKCKGCIGCKETTEKLASIFEADGISQSTIEKDLKECVSVWKVIEIENPGKPGKKVLKLTAKVYSFLSENTESIMDRKKAKEVFEGRNILRTQLKDEQVQDRKNKGEKTVKNYGQDRKNKGEKTVKNYGHNINRKETLKINSLSNNDERENFENFELKITDKKSFSAKVFDLGLIDNIEHLIKTIGGEDPKKEGNSIIGYFAEKNQGQAFNSKKALLDRFNGYLTKGIHRTRPKPVICKISNLI